MSVPSLSARSEAVSLHASSLLLGAGGAFFLAAPGSSPSPPSGVASFGRDPTLGRLLRVVFAISLDVEAVSLTIRSIQKLLQSLQ